MRRKAIITFLLILRFGFRSHIHLVRTQLSVLGNLSMTSFSQQWRTVEQNKTDDLFIASSETKRSPVSVRTRSWHWFLATDCTHYDGRTSSSEDQWHDDIFRFRFVIRNQFTHNPVLMVPNDARSSVLLSSESGMIYLLILSRQFRAFLLMSLHSTERGNEWSVFRQLIRQLNHWKTYTL